MLCKDAMTTVLYLGKYIFFCNQTIYKIMSTFKKKKHRQSDLLKTGVSTTQGLIAPSLADISVVDATILKM